MNKQTTFDLPVKSLSRSLTNRVLLLSLIGAIGLGSTIVLGLLVTLNHVQARMDKVNTGASSAFDRFFLYIQGDLQATSYGLASRNDKNAALLALRMRNKACLDIFFIDPERIILAQHSVAGRPKRTEIGKLSWLELPLPPGKVILGPVLFEEQVPVVDMAISVTDDIGLGAGFLIVRVDLTQLWNTTLDIKVGDTGYSYITDNTGQLVAFRDQHLIESGGNLEKLAGRTPQAITKARMSFYTGLCGEPVLASAQPLTTVPWFAIVEQPAREALAPFLLPVIVLLIALIIVVLLLSTTIRFTHFRITAPLLALRDSVVEMAGGQLNQSIEGHCNDELGQLAHSFNRMAFQLHKAFADLECRIDALRKAQAALRESEERYRGLFEGIPVGLYRTTEAGEILDVNITCAGMLGFKTRGEMLSHNELEFWVHPGTRSLMASGTNADGAFELESQFRTHDNRIIWVHNKGRVIRGGQGDILYFEGSLEDITVRKQTEEALKQSEEKFRQLTEKSIVGIYISQDELMTYANPSLARMLKYLPGEIGGKLTFHDLIHPGDIELVKIKMQERLEGKIESNNFVYRAMRKDGSIMYFEVYGMLITYQGKPAVMGTVIDVTERKHTEQMRQILHELILDLNSSSDLRQGLDKVLKAVLQLECIDSGGIYIADPNDNSLDLVAHQGLTQEFIEHSSQYPPGSPQVRMVMTGETHYGMYNTIRPVKDEIREKEGLRAFAIIPIMNQGQLIALLNLASHSHDYIPPETRSMLETIALQVSGTLLRLRTEFALRESEARLNSILNNASNIVFLKNLEGRYITINRRFEELFHVSRQTIAGKSDYDIFPAEFADKLRQHDSYALEKGAPTEMEELIPQDDGLHIYITAKFPLLGMDGKPYAVCGIATDITDRKQAEEKIIKSLREKETLIRELYHRTKNTMQVIRGMLVLQAAEFPANAELQRVVKNTEQRIQAISLVHKMLYQTQDLSRISIKEYVCALADLIIQSSGVSGDRIALDIKIENQYFLLDTAIPFGLILTELLTNSLKYAFPDNQKGTITITLTRGETGKNILYYADNGAGVPAGFEFRKQNTLGLQLIYSIGEQQMMGSVNLKNDNGVACVFEFQNDLYKARV